MRGSIRKRYEGSWSLILDLGYQVDPATGLRKRRQKWVTFRGTKRDAQVKLNDLLGAANRGEYVERSKITVAARKFLGAAKQAGPQMAAFGALALDSGARKGELCGLRWSDLDLEAETVTFVRQLTKPGKRPSFGPIKNEMPRTVDLAAETIALLREHKRAQAELKMANRTAYHDLGLVFAKERGHLHGREDSLGLPLQSNNLGQRELARVMKAAKVRPITVHGLRHTSATLLLKAGVPPQVVQQRLGHKRIEITLGIYAHVLPSMQQDAARRLASLLHG